MSSKKKPSEDKRTQDEINGEEMAPNRNKRRYVVQGDAGYTEAPPGRGQFGVYDITTHQFAAILTSKEEAIAWAKQENKKIEDAKERARLLSERARELNS